MTKIKCIYDAFCKCETIQVCAHNISYLSEIEEDYNSAYNFEQIIYMYDTILELNFICVGFSAFHKLFNNILKMPKLQKIVPACPCEKFIPNKIALMQNLNSLDFFGYDNSDYKCKTYKKYKEKFDENKIIGYYIYKNKMLIYYPMDNTYIPPNIKYLNITYYPEYSSKLVKILNNLPYNLEHLHLTIDIKDYQLDNLLSNLPISLKSFILTFVNNQKLDKINKLLDNIKIPFGCILNIESKKIY